MSAISSDTRRLARDLRISVVIPVYNNVATVGDVIAAALEWCDDITVVDDGSDDGTAEMLKTFSDKITILTHKKNRGKGAALSTAFRHLRAQGFVTAITMDADGQHRASDLPRFIRKAAENPDTIIIGRRSLDKVDIKASSSFANRFSNLWFTIHTFKRLKDTQTGFRAYPLRRYPSRMPFTSRYEAELSILVNASWKGVPIVETDTDVYYPPRDERVSHFRPGLDFFRISLLNTVQTLFAVVYGWPRTGLRALGNAISGHELKMMTRIGDRQRDASLTVGRVLRSTYGGLFFTFYTTLLSPFVTAYFAVARPSERSRMKFHKLLRNAARYILYRLPGSRFSFINDCGEDFSVPAMVICNHQSHLDLMALMSVSEKFIFLTNERVWNNFMYGSIVRRAEYQSTSQGMEAITDNLRKLVARGYSIVVFPEGTRCGERAISRFRQGAFHLAYTLGLDIVTMALHGAGDFMSKNDIVFRRNPIVLQCVGRSKLPPEGIETKIKTAAHYREEVSAAYQRIAEKYEDICYFSALVRYKYVWRGRKTVREAKRIIRCMRRNNDTSPVFLSDQKVLVLNAGIGVEALFWALLNPRTVFHVYESDMKRLEIMAETPDLPENLVVIKNINDVYHLAADITRRIVVTRRETDKSLYGSLATEYFNILNPKKK